MNWNKVIFYGLSGFVLAMLILLFGRNLMMLFFTLLLGFGLIFMFSDLISWRRKKIADRAFLDSPEGKAKKRIEQCEEEIQKIEAEIAPIAKDIQDLKGRLKTPLTDENKEKTLQLIKGFEAEINIRRAKMRFLTQAIVRMNQMLSKYQTRQLLEDKEEKLKHLQEGHYEDLADLEALRSDVEMDVFLLEDIETLRLKTLSSSSVESIEALQKELEVMTKDLGEK